MAAFVQSSKQQPRNDIFCDFDNTPTLHYLALSSKRMKMLYQLDQCSKCLTLVTLIDTAVVSDSVTQFKWVYFLDTGVDSHTPTHTESLYLSISVSSRLTWCPPISLDSKMASHSSKKRMASLILASRKMNLKLSPADMKPSEGKLISKTCREHHSRVSPLPSHTHGCLINWL